MIHHSAVSLDYLEERMKGGITAPMKDRLRGFPPSQLAVWKAKGYTYIPPCDSMAPDGRCAGHEKE